MPYPELDRAVDHFAERAFDLLERLVGHPSTIGDESGAQEELAAELEHCGFDLVRLRIPSDIGDAPGSGVPRLSYDGRYDLVGRRGTTLPGRSLLLNGHMDVVPAENRASWSRPPFAPHRVDGWMVGRGTGDMKGGFAAGMLALWALDSIEPGWQTGALTFVSAIEEEATGNGTLASGLAGYLADAVLLLEPTDLEILLGGISLTWVTIVLQGHAGHAEAALTSVNPIEALPTVIAALTTMEREFNDEHQHGDMRDAAFRDIPHPYNLNIGRVAGGDWASSVPSMITLEVRIGHPGALTAEQVCDRVRNELAAATAAADGFAGWFAEHPPTVTLTGYRAERYLQPEDGEIVTALSAAHKDLHGSPPRLTTIGSTTDARFYLNQFGVPALAYGPVTRNIHGADEAVDLESIVATAKTVARFLRGWYADPGAS